jgi:hypothetical protein
MLGCANWRGLRFVPRTELFHFIRHSKVFYCVLRLFPIYCFRKPNREFGVALHRRDLPFTGGRRELLRC